MIPVAPAVEPVIQRFEVTLGQVVTNGIPGAGAGILETAGAADVFTFNATAGQTVYFDARTGNPCDFRLRWKCLGPTNQIVFDQWFAASPGCGNGDPGTIVLEAAGTYTLTVYGAGNATGPYSFSVVPVAPQTFALSLGQVVTNGVPGTGAGNVETAGAADVFTFNAAAGQTVYFDALTENPCDFRLRWKCLGPTNQVVFDQWFAASSGCGNGDPGAVVLNATGAYTLTVYGGGDATGPYSFNVLPVVPQTFALTPGQAVTNGVPGAGAGVIETAGASDVFTFNATAGQTVYFDAITGNPCDFRLRWKCVGPTHQVLFDQWFAATPGCGNGDPGTLVLEIPGTYTLTVYGSTDATGPYSFNVVPVIPQTFAWSLGQVVTNGVPGAGAGVIETAGTSDVFTFQGTAGQAVYFDALTGNPCDFRLRWKCLGPTNRVLFDQWFAASSGCGNGDPGIVVLEATGTYTLTVYGGTDATGPYSFSVVPTVSQSFAVSLGQVVTNGVPSAGAGNLETPGASDLFTFDATAGQTVYFDALTGNPCDFRLRWKCLGPTNQVVFDQWFAATPGCGNGDPGNQTFTNAGTYSIVVYGNADATGGYSFRLLAPAPVIVSQPADVNAIAGGTAVFAVRAVSESRLRYQWQFNGVNLPGQTNDTLTLSRVQVAQSGTYAVFVDNDSGRVASRAASLVVRAYVSADEAVRRTLPPVPGNGVAIELFNGIGGGGVPAPETLVGRVPDGATLSPLIDFPSPGTVINVGTSFDTFFAATATPPAQVSGLAAQNFTLRHQFLLRVSSDLDLVPSTPEIDVELGVGSDDGFHLTVGTNVLATAGDRGFSYTWVPVAFGAEGLYPISLLYAANANGQSGLEFAWKTSTNGGGAIVPQTALYLSPNVGDRLVTFEEVPVGTVLTNQFAEQGVVFETLGGHPRVTDVSPDRFVPVSPRNVVADPDAGATAGAEIELRFVVPGTSSPAVTDFVSFFVLDAEAIGATVAAFDGAGSVVFTNSYHGGRATQEPVDIAAPRIARVRITLGQGSDTVALDHLSFTRPARGADLVVGPVSVPSIAAPGSALTIVWGVTNTGIAPAVGPWTEQVVAAQDPPGRDLRILGTVRFDETLAPGASLVRTQTVVLPPDGPAGTLLLGVRVDADNDLLELSEQNNATFATQPTQVPPTLTLELASRETVEGGAPIPVTVVRNGDVTSPLTVNLSNSQSGSLIAPTSVTLPAGRSSFGFEVSAPTDGVVDGARVARITATAEGFVGGEAAVTIADIDVPTLGLELRTPNVVEGAIARAVVRRELPRPDPLTVYFSAADPDRVQLPPDVTIPADATEVAFEFVALDDFEVGPPRRVTITAYAVGHLDSPAVTLNIADNDLPALTFDLEKRQVSEGDGPQATVATLTRSAAGSVDLPFAVVSSDSAVVRVPGRIILGAGRQSVSFPVAAVENSMTNATRDVVLTAYPLDPATQARLSPGLSAVLSVTDDDGPALRVVIARRLVREGLSPATTATLTRTGDLSQALVVSLSSSDSGEAIVPPTVTLAAGQASAVFDIDSVEDGLGDGSQLVTIRATAPGLSPGADTLVVSDLERPDLVAIGVAAPATAATEAPVNVSYRIRNQGLVPSTTNILTRVFLSRDGTIGDDVVAGQFDFAGTLPPGEAIEQTLQIRMPVAPGDYWVVVMTDVEDHVLESLEDNNTSLATAPIHVREAYTATVEAADDRYVAGTPVLLRGRAYQADSTVPARQVPVHVHLLVRETRRVLLALTDDDGNFAVTFQPLPNEAGRYEIAAAHPGVVPATSQDRFTLVGFLGRPPTEPIELVEHETRILKIPLENLSDVPLQGLQGSVVSGPANVKATFDVSGDGVLAGWGTGIVRVALEATDSSVPRGDVVVRVTSGEGAIAEFKLAVEVRSGEPMLVTTPTELVGGMKRGGQAVVEFDLVNRGGAATGPISVLTPDLPWLRVASPVPLAGLEPGGTNRVTLLLTPAPDLGLGEYAGALVVRAGGTSVSVPFRFRALAEAVGDLRVTAVDEYTYYAEGSPRVTNAVVTVRDAVSSDLVAEGVTDSTGQLLVPGILEGYYDIEVTADRHVAYRGTSLVRAGVTEEVQAFLSRETVRYLWTVEPTEIEDRTRISIETVFETFVPIPVVTIEPNVIDLAEITADVTQIDLRISNHGLIAANDFRLGFSAHPDWQLEPLVNELGALPARSSLVIPLTIRRLKPPALASARPGPALHAGGPCGITGGAIWTLVCGNKKSYSAPIHILNVGSDCGGGGGSWGGSGSVGGPFASVPFFNTKLDCNTNTPPCKPLDLPEVNLSGLLKPLAKAFDGLANFYLEKNIWTRVLGLEVETEPEAKGKLSLCCTNNTPVEEISATLSGKVKVNVGDSYKAKVKESFPDYVLANNIKGVLELDGDLTFGVAAEPSFKVSGSYKDGCGRKKPEISVTITGAVEIQGGAFGKAKASFKALDAPVKLDESFVNGGIKGSLEFSWTYSNDGKSKFCYKSEGLYVQANAKLFGIGVDMFYPTNKYFLIPSAEICDPPESLLAELGLDHALAEARRQVDAAAREHSARLGLHSTPPDEGAGVCAQVRLKLDQDLILTRNAFAATLEIDNQDPAQAIEALEVRIGILNAAGRGADDRFDIRTNRLEGITAVDGTGTLLPATRGTVSWILVPTSEAAPEAPVNYRVGGILSYRQGGRTITVPLTDVPITVQPDPRLHVRYFHQRDVYSDDPFTPVVEPAVPYSLAVMIRNSGKGIARNVRITSAQPQIVENEKGLLIDFKILGTEVAGRPATPSLTAEFGQIDPGQISIGRWLLTSTLQGLFVDYQANIQHTAGDQERRTSLIDEVDIHEMIHLVQAQGTSEDGKPDFLVNDVPDPEDLPDRLYLSDGSIERVGVQREGTIGGTLSDNKLVVSLSVAPPQGWTYLRLADPGRGDFKLLRVTRSDGRVIAFGTNVWTTDRTFLGQGRKPRRENLLHLLDDGGPGTYTLEYGRLAPLESIPPTSRVDPLPANSFALIPVTWSGVDNPGGSGVGTFDVFVSINGGPFATWLEQTPNTGAVYRGRLGDRYAFYSVATDTLGNREAVHASADAETVVTRENHPPTMAVIPDQSVEEGEVLVVSPTAADPDNDTLAWSLVGAAPAGIEINPLTGLITWLTGEGLGPGTVPVTVQVLDNGLPRLGTTRSFNVRIQDRNAIPLLAPIGDQTINEGRLLRLTVTATDADLPRQHLRFGLVDPAPPGASINPDTGEFTWRPSQTQGGTTNRLTIVVTDDGLPPQQATESFRIIVRDTQQDFTLQLGTTNLVPGATASVPITLQSQAGLTRVAFFVELPVPRVSGFVIEPLVAQLGTAVVLPAATNRVRVQLDAAPGQILPGGTDLARLRFGADRGPGSAVVPLRLAEVTGVGSAGEPLLNASVIHGKAFLIEAEPLLDARLSADGGRQLVLYGRAGRSYEVQYRTNLVDGSPWGPLGSVTLETGSGTLTAPALGAASVFYRAVERNPDSPELGVGTSGSGNWALLIHGLPGRTVRIESRTELATGPWHEEARIVLTNGVHRLENLIQNSGTRFFRAVAE